MDNLHVPGAHAERTFNLESADDAWIQHGTWLWSSQVERDLRPTTPLPDCVGGMQHTAPDDAVGQRAADSPDNATVKPTDVPAEEGGATDSPLAGTAKNDPAGSDATRHVPTEDATTLSASDAAATADSKSDGAPDSAPMPLPDEIVKPTAEEIGRRCHCTPRGDRQEMMTTATSGEEEELEQIATLEPEEQFALNASVTQGARVPAFLPVNPVGALATEQDGGECKGGDDVHAQARIVGSAYVTDDLLVFEPDVSDEDKTNMRHPLAGAECTRLQ